LTPKIAGADSTYCNCLGDGERPAINTTPQLVDLPRVFSYLEAQGFLLRRVRASLAARIPDLRAAFDEGWFYAMVRDVLPGESLSVEIEREALHQARTSWPVSWLLGRYYMQRGDPRWESVLAQFGTLLAQETNVARLAKFQDDVQSSLAEVLAQCSAEQAADLVPVLANHLLLREEEVRQRGAKKLERAGRGRATSHLARRDETATRQR
jgi:hypothetical protein